MPVQRAIGRVVIEPLLDFCYPRRCAACNDRFEPAAVGQSAVLCEPCALAMDEIAAAPSCARCAMPAVEAGAPCPHCLNRGLSPFERVVSLGLFVQPMKRLVHRAKYAGRWPLAEELAERVMRRADNASLLAQVDLIVPVPLHRRRQIGRGYNQAEVIARRIGRLAGKRVANVVLRAHHTAVQAKLHSRVKRFENLREAFLLERPRVPEGKRILVVDDVLTSGATLVAMGRCLSTARPEKLFGLVLAVADPKGRSFEVI